MVLEQASCCFVKVVVLGNWIGFRVAPKVAVLTKTLRMMLEQVLKNKIQDPSMDVSGRSSQNVLNAISMLMLRASTVSSSTNTSESSPDNSRSESALDSTVDAKGAAQSKSTARSKSWRCNECTFINVPRLHGTKPYCSMCETPRPKQKPEGRDEALAWTQQYEESTRVLVEAQKLDQDAMAKANGRKKGKQVKRYGQHCDAPVVGFDLSFP